MLLRGNCSAKWHPLKNSNKTQNKSSAFQFSQSQFHQHSMDALRQESSGQLLPRNERCSNTLFFDSTWEKNKWCSRKDFFGVSFLLSIYQLTLKHSSGIWNSASRRLLRADLHTHAREASRETSSSSCLANSKYSYGRKLNSNLPRTSAGSLTLCDIHKYIIINSQMYAEQNQLESTP